MYHNVNISNLGNVLQRNLRTNRAAKEYILEHLEMSLQNQSKTVEAIERSQNKALQLLNLNGPQELAGYLYKKIETYKLKSVRIK